MNRRRMLPIAILLAATACATPALGQIALNESVVTSASPDSGAIAAFANQWGPALAGQDVDERARARRNLLRALNNTEATVPFRLAYQNALMPHLSRAIGAGSDQAVGALRIAGNLATPRATEAIETALSSSDDTVRFSAASSAGRAFKAVTTAQPALPAERLVELSVRLGRVVSGDASSAVAEAAARSLSQGADLGLQGFEAVESAATEALLAGLAGRLGDPELDPGAVDVLAYTAIIRGLESARTRINANEADRTSTVLAARVAGNALGMASRDIDTAEGTDLAVLADLAGTCEALIFFAAEALGGRGEEFNLQNAANRSPDAFRAAADNLIGAGGQLAGAPFNLDPAEFARD